MNNVWTSYKLGFKYFKLTTDTTENINNSDLKYLHHITITAVYNSGSELTSAIYVDNMALDANYNSYTTNLVEVIS